mmetsp:Transcript_37346/g.68315  ORF Transcript_37346/g.68315 Transcript_37346/m.68315 type:complete len:130 (-) Transcript_37346:31-420(-)
MDVSDRVALPEEVELLAAEERAGEHDAEVLKTSDGDVSKALAEYSRTRVPEGHALLDLSTGPSSGLSRAILGVKNIFDGLGVTGSKQLQVELTTSLRPFADIRRDLDPFYGPFPTEEEFAASIPKEKAD